tara:strand:- start:1523 stop:2257 length:735 start_codon:yes stop_codon:yes gene_type:complete
MISKSKIKLIKSLKYKKTRDELNLFLVEGLKGILEVNKSNYDIHFTVISKKIYNQYKNFLPSNNIFILSENEINKLSSLQNNFVGFSVVKTIFKDRSKNNLDKITIALDSISDPGNLGAIIRNADWFGIKNIICSKSCVDLYNPKTIQSSMGSFTRVNVYYEDLDNFFNTSDLKVIGTSSNTKSNFKKNKSFQGVILFGNESHGISKNLLNYVDQWLSIKKIGEAESLNVAVATGIIMNELTTD